MPVQDFSSNKPKWQDIAVVWNDYKHSPFQNMQAALEKAEEAIDFVNAFEGGRLGTASISITQEDVMECFEHCKMMWDIGNGFHYEADELIDQPFSMLAAEAMEDAYALDPDDITLATGEGWFGGVKTLRELVERVILDDVLARSFAQAVDLLNHDVPDWTLQEAVIDAEFWGEQYHMAEQLRELAAQHFTPQVCADWESMSPEERQRIVEEFAYGVGAIYGQMGGSNTVELVLFGEGTKMGGGGIMQLSEGYLTKKGATATPLDIIDAVIHEGRHSYQDGVTGGSIQIPTPAEVHTDFSDYESSGSAYYYCGKEYDARAFAASVCAGLF